MTRLRLALVAAATFAVLGQTTTAHADPPAGPPPAGSSSGVVAAAEKTAATSTSASMGTVMVVLDVLGLVDKGAPTGAARVHAALRTPTWLQPEPPPTPVFYSSLVVTKF